VDVVYGCECDVVHGYVMDYIVYGYVMKYIVYPYVMKYIEYGCECSFKFLAVQLMIPISVFFSFHANL
jgi:hypothetical protein